ncbi:hypothetical protein [Aliiroseovarius subalbicans]|uniref:hypothetical protein n=1 Tax=Aliiroseovarius subalbicans TaxID=2925840 RepID=UPI001F5657B1|nr:hypothetical protein [Aliiroseovarius subalbicans]
MNGTVKTRFYLLTTGVFLVILWVYFMFLAPRHALPNTSADPLALPVVLCLSALLAGALASLVSLFTSNRHRLRAVLRPSLGRVSAAFVMGMLTPFAVFSGIPWIAGGLLFFGFASPFQMSFWGSLTMIWAAAVGAGALTAIWYLPSALIISGVKSRTKRVALFALLWWGAYAALLLYSGHEVFQL